MSREREDTKVRGQADQTVQENSIFSAITVKKDQMTWSTLKEAWQDFKHAEAQFTNTSRSEK